MKDVNAFGKYVFYFLLVFFLFPFSQAGAGEPAGEITQEDLDREVENVIRTGSNLSYARLMMLEKKSGKTGEDSTGQIQSGRQDRLRYQLARPYLKKGLHGGFSKRDNGYYLGEELEILTGKRAVDESLQLQSIDTRENRDKSRIYDIAGVKRLKIKTHPWDQMLKEHDPVERPEILQLIPEDHFLVYFKDISRLSMLENASKELLAGADYFFDVKTLLDMRRKVSRRLEIQDLEKLESLVSEAAFLSEDLSFYPRTHYAVVLKFKIPVGNMPNALLASRSCEHKLIGDYLVIATSKRLLERIENTYQKKIPSLRDAKDLEYAMAVLDQRRDGLVYFSEKFILKMVSPEIRINAGRRNIALKKLETLQYTVFAYHSITGKWPQSIAQIADEGYISSREADPEFRIDDQGRVAHDNWGSLYSPKALSDVEIRKVTGAEKTRYGNFRDGYQGFWREFFDPVGVAVTVSDKLYFHTIILPLIDNSDYRELGVLAGGDPKIFKSLQTPLRYTPVALRSKLNFNDFVLHLPGRPSRRKGMTRAELKQDINEELTKFLRSDEALDIFDIVGDELILGVGRDIPLKLQNLANLDLFVGISLKDRKRFEKLINTIYGSIFKNMSNQPSFMFFQLSTDAPLKNSYKSVEYQMIPAGFVNLFYFFHEDFVYFTINQRSMNKLIDGIGSSEEMPGSVKRSLDYIEPPQNILMLADLSVLQNAKRDLLEVSMKDPGTWRHLRNMRGYLEDISILNRSLQTDPLGVQRYFGKIPNRIYGVDIELSKEGIYLGNEKRYSLNKIEFPNAPYYWYASKRKEQKEANLISFDTLLTEPRKKEILAGIDRLKDLSIGLSFTPEGLDTKVIISNPLVGSEDQRFAADLKAVEPEKQSPIELALIVAAIMLGAVILIIFSLHSALKKNS
jgi:hypothetical protein